MRALQFQVVAPLLAIAVSVGYLNIWDLLNWEAYDLGLGDVWNDYQTGWLVAGWPRPFIFFNWNWPGLVLNLLLAVFLLVGSASALSVWSRPVESPARLSLGGVFAITSVAALVFGEAHVRDYWYDSMADRTDDVCFGIVSIAFGLSVLGLIAFVRWAIQRIVMRNSRDRDRVPVTGASAAGILAATIGNSESPRRQQSAWVFVSLLAASILYLNLFPLIDDLRTSGADKFSGGLFESGAIVGWPRAFIWYEWSGSNFIVDMLAAAFLLVGSATYLIAPNSLIGLPICSIHKLGIVAVAMVIFSLVEPRMREGFNSMLTDRTDDLCFAVVCIAFPMAIFGTFELAGRWITQIRAAIGR